MPESMLQEQEPELGKDLLSDLLGFNSEDAINNIIQQFGEDDLDYMDVARTFYYSCPTIPCLYILFIVLITDVQLFLCQCLPSLSSSILDLSDISYWFTYIINLTFSLSIYFGMNVLLYREFSSQVERCHIENITMLQLFPTTLLFL